MDLSSLSGGVFELPPLVAEVVLASEVLPLADDVNELLLFSVDGLVIETDIVDGDVPVVAGGEGATGGEAIEGRAVILVVGSTSATALSTVVVDVDEGTPGVAAVLVLRGISWLVVSSLSFIVESSWATDVPSSVTAFVDVGIGSAVLIGGRGAGEGVGPLEEDGDVVVSPSIVACPADEPVSLNLLSSLLYYRWSPRDPPLSEMRMRACPLWKTLTSNRRGPLQLCSEKMTSL